MPLQTTKSSRRLTTFNNNNNSNNNIIKSLGSNKENLIQKQMGVTFFFFVEKNRVTCVSHFLDIYFCINIILSQEICNSTN